MPLLVAVSIEEQSQVLEQVHADYRFSGFDVRGGHSHMVALLVDQELVHLYPPLDLSAVLPLGSAAAFCT